MIYYYYYYFLNRFLQHFYAALCLYIQHSLFGVIWLFMHKNGLAQCSNGAKCVDRLCSNGIWALSRPGVYSNTHTTYIE